jgi:hypothetical protein
MALERRFSRICAWDSGGNISDDWIVTGSLATRAIRRAHTQKEGRTGWMER